MTDTAALQKLLTWLSPVFPVGSFAYSAGLETEIAARRIDDAKSTEEWIAANLRHGGARNDAILLAASHRAHASAPQLAALADLALALSPALERTQEITTIGDSFVEAATAWPCAAYQNLPRPCPYAIAVGAISAMHGVALADVLPAFLLAYCQSQVSVAIRLVPLGQTAGLKILATLEPAITAAAAAAQTTTLDDLGAIGYASDIAAMAHETLHTRIFRS